MQEIFRAAQHFSRQDRSYLVDERRKVQSLMGFLSAQGFYIQDINSFSETGTMIKKGLERNLFDKSPELQKGIKCGF